MARLARKQLSDIRAMEEQKMGENVLDGRGATPSMGLSQVRGGSRTGRYEGEGMDGGFIGSVISAVAPSVIGAVAPSVINAIKKLFGAGKMSKEAHDELLECCQKPKKSRAKAKKAEKAEKAESEEEKVGGSRKKRSDIVKQVMKDKGMKMIEASSYVKTHGLYVK